MIPLAILPDRRLLREGVAAAAGAGAVAPARPDLAGPREGRPAYRRIGRKLLPPLRITVVNGDLTFEENPLLIGHYRASRLTGTERVMNEVIGGAMKHSLDLGLYPLAPGSHQIFLNTKTNPEEPRRMPRPKAVVVVGLGAEGKLSAVDLARTVQQAVIAWAQHRPNWTRTLRVLRPWPLLFWEWRYWNTAGQAAQRIVQGVYAANQLLSDEHERPARVGRECATSGSSNSTWTARPKPGAP